MKNRIPPPVLLLITGTIMWFVAHSTFAHTMSVPYASVIAVVLAGIGVTIDVLALLEFRSVQTTVNPLKPENATSLVRNGIFNRSRNPMYLGLLFILTGWAVWLGSPGNIAVLILFVPLITALQIKPEEAALTTLFGQEYVDYCQQVRRWV
jgi:protein-S-isoprenylcysteine O-methyltransferase Ste14